MVSTILTIVIALIAAIVCSLVVFLLTRLQEKDTGAKLGQLTAENQRLLPLQDENQRLKIENATLLQRMEAEQGKTNWLDSAEVKLRDAFNALAADALKGNSTLFIQQSSDQVKGIIEPLNRDLEKLVDQVRLLEQKREGAYSGLLTQVSSLKDAHESLNRTTTMLQQALKSPTARGKWGQVALRNIVEMSGMVSHIDFDEQQTTESGDRPDMVIHLPNQGTIPLDAKAPMDAYLAAVESKDPEDKIRHLEEHRVAVRAHVKALSKKGYWARYDQAAEFVIMFIPYESGLEASFSQDPGILQEALESKVIVVSPATLLALLKVISFGWLQLQLAKNAQDIADQAKELMNRISTFIKHFNDIGSKLNSSVEAYNKAVGSMDSRIMPSLKRLKDMGTTTEELSEVKHIENSARLTDAVGPDGITDGNSK